MAAKQVPEELAHQRVLREEHLFLMDNICVSELRDHMFAKGWLSLDDLEDIDEHKGDRKQARVFLKKLMQKPFAAFQELLQALRDTKADHVVEQLQYALEQEQQKQNTADSSPGRPTSLRPLTHHDLPFEANSEAGFSSDGNVVLASELDPSQLYLYELSDGKYREVWKKPLPSGLTYYCNKAVNNTEIALQGKHCTHHYSHNLQQHHTSRHNGNLLDLLDDGSAAFRRLLAGSDSGVIDVYPNNGERSLTLQPPAGCAWGGNMSVCQLSEGQFAVVDYNTRSLTVLNREGQVVSYCSLPYRPSWPKAVTACGERHLAVVDNDTLAIHVYTHDGEEVMSARKDDLQLPGSVQWLQGIWYSPSSVLHVAAGDTDTIASLHAYQVEFSDNS